MGISSATLLFALLPLSGCAYAPAPVPSPAPAVEAPAQPAETAPRPFTAGQIRGAMPKGHVLRLRMEAAGKPTVIEVWTVVEADAETMTMATQVYGEDGALREDQGAEVAKWSELVEHAAFPAAATLRTEGEAETALGTLATITYEVTKPGDDGVPVVSRFVFAKALPGPPVLLTVTRQGIVLRKMTILERK